MQKTNDNCMLMSVKRNSLRSLCARSSTAESTKSILRRRITLRRLNDIRNINFLNATAEEIRPIYAVIRN